MNADNTKSPLFPPFMSDPDFRKKMKEFIKKDLDLNKIIKNSQNNDIFTRDCCQELMLCYFPEDVSKRILLQIIESGNERNSKKAKKILAKRDGEKKK